MTASVRLNHRHFLPACAALFAIALLVGLRGMVSLPPDEHEILVLRTAQEMHSRGDWVVPYFNDEARLKKPPLSYWLTGFTSWAAGAAERIEAWHGRTPSLLAGLTMLGLILWAGRRFHGPRAALYAGVSFVASVGYFTYTHDGRPDLLYAALCTAGWLAGAVGLVEARGARPATMLWMWAAFGWATLAKGPHVPAMLLAAMLIYCLLRARAGGPRPGALRPVTGLALVAAIALPWWLLLHSRIDPSAVRGSQLAGKLLMPSLRHLFNGYYLYRPLQVLLPWVPLSPLAWLALARVRGPARDFALYLALCAGVVALLLSLGAQQRFFYMLPVLPALCLLTGMGLASWEARSRASAVAAAAVQVLAITLGVAWLFWREGELGLFALLSVAALSMACLLGWQASRRLPALMVLGGVLAAAGFARYADAPVLWSIARFQRHELAHTVAAVVPPERPLLSYALTPVVYIQVTGRSIPEVHGAAALERAMRARDLAALHVIALVKRRAELRERFKVRELASMPATANDRAGLYLLTLRHP